MKKAYKIIGVISGLLIIGIICGIIFNSMVKRPNDDKTKVYINGKTYYQRLNDNTWKGEYHKDNFDTANKVDNILKVGSYKEYLETISLINTVSFRTEDEIIPYYSNKNCNYILLSYLDGNGDCDMELVDCLEENNKIIIYGDEEIFGGSLIRSGFFIAIPTNMPVGTEIEYIECYSDSEINNLREYGSPRDPNEPMSLDKPIVYLYPEEKTEVTVELGNPEKLTCTYPKYKDSWRVMAEPNGNLIDLETGRNLYALYWEGINTAKRNEDEGFVVKGEDTIEFLEEKLEKLGLTEREANEFIMYWLPQMEDNKYNFIRFETMEEINENMPLNISPKPDSVIRVLMAWKPLDEMKYVKEQKIETPVRTGFSVVEWGGSKI